MSSTSSRRVAPGVDRGRIRARPRTTTVHAATSSMAQHTTAQTIGTLITAFTAVGALVFTGLSLNATRDQLDVAQQGQYTDRYTKAVEQLDQTGPEHLQTRVGGIYALQRLSIDSSRDQPTIVNLLVTFITSTIQRTDRTTGADTCPTRTAPDIQAAFTVLIERDRRLDTDTTPDLGMSLPTACLPSSRLGSAYLQKADLHEADLRKADLREADLRWVNLAEADLTNADLRGAQLSVAHLARTNLVGAGLSGVDLTDSYLGKADLSGAQLTGAGLRRTNLIWANLTDADLSGADLAKAYLVGADLSYADLTGADLRGANLKETKHDYADINGAITDSTTIGKWW